MSTAEPEHSKRYHGLAALLASLAAVGPFSIDAYLPSMGADRAALQASPYACSSRSRPTWRPFALMMLWQRGDFPTRSGGAGHPVGHGLFCLASPGVRLRPEHRGAAGVPRAAGA